MELHIIFDGPPGPVAGRFIEVETPDGRSICAGEWKDRGDGTWALVIQSYVERERDEVHDGMLQYQSEAVAGAAGPLRPDCWQVWRTERYPPPDDVGPFCGCAPMACWEPFAVDASQIVWRRPLRRQPPVAEARSSRVRQ